MARKPSRHQVSPPSGEHVFESLYPEGFPAEAQDGEGPPADSKQAGASSGTEEEGRAEFPRQPIRGAWWLAPLALFVFGAGAVVLTQSGVGYTWDEAYYYSPSKKAAAWLAEFIAAPAETAGREKIDAFWHERSEHPSFHKLLTGISLRLLEERWDPIQAMRLPAALLFGATLSLIFLTGARIWDEPSGLIAAAAYAAMPRIFGHAHLSSMETPLLFSMTLTLYCFIRGLSSPGWAAACGASFGLLLATKINAFFMIPPLILWGQLFARRKYVNNVFACLTLGPLGFVLFWPWLWHDAPIRILQYLQFHATHQQTALWFLDQKWGYGDQNAPWFYPSVMMGVTLPLGVLFLSGLGILLGLIRFRRRKLPLLVLLVGLTMWGVASAPPTPKYDGVRLFLPVFPCVALMAGGGAAGILALTRWSARKRGVVRQEVTLLACVMFFALVAEGAWGVSRVHPYALSYFNPIVGGLAGADEKGFEVEYWGLPLNEEAVSALNRMIPDGGALKVLALHELCFLQLQQWGKLKSTIRIGGAPPYYAHLVLHRKGFYGRPERALVETDAFPRMIRWSHDGVPLLTLYRTGPSFEAYWPRQAPSP